MNIIDIAIICVALVCMTLGCILGARKGLGDAISGSFSWVFGLFFARHLLSSAKSLSIYSSWLERFGNNEKGLDLLIVACLFAVISLVLFAILKSVLYLLGTERNSLSGHVGGLLLGTLLICNLVFGLNVGYALAEHYIPSFEASFPEVCVYVNSSLILKSLQGIIVTTLF